MPAKTHVDWDAVEIDYRAGVMSNYDIASKHNTNESNVRGMARRRGWRREAEIVRAAAHKAIAMVPPEPPKIEPPRPPDPPEIEIDVEPPEPPHVETPMPSRELQDMTAKVDELASLAVDVVKSHRRDASRLRQLVLMHREELVGTFNDLPILEERIVEYFSAKAALNPLAAGVYRQEMQRALAAISLGSRSKTLLNLVSAFEKVVSMERASFHLDKEADDKTYDEAVREIHQRALEAKKAKQRSIN